MQELTNRAEQMLEVIEQVRFLNVSLAKYCTEECDKCPLCSECLGEGLLDPDADYNIEKCADFIDYYDRWQAKKDAEALQRENEEFTEITGIDYGWYLFNDDRSDRDR